MEAARADGRMHPRHQLLRQRGVGGAVQNCDVQQLGHCQQSAGRQGRAAAWLAPSILRAARQSTTGQSALDGPAQGSRELGCMGAALRLRGRRKQASICGVAPAAGFVWHAAHWHVLSMLTTVRRSIWKAGWHESGERDEWSDRMFRT
jgi:hypothetical protein